MDKQAARSLMKTGRAGLLACALCAAPALAGAQQGSLLLGSFPSIGVADGRSTLTLSAEVRDGVGRLVRDGTQVVFETDKGTFLSRNVVGTQAGIARIVMVAPSLPGTARVRASAFSINATSFLEIEFFADRSLLDSAQDYVEVVSPDRLEYSPQHRVLDAEAPDGGVRIRYRDVVVTANRAQLAATTYQLRATGATVQIGEHKQVFQEVYLRLDRRRGYGVTVEEGPYMEVVRNGVLATVRENPGPKLAVVEIGPAGFAPGDQASDLRDLAFADTSSAVSTVQCRKAVVFPSSHIQFHRANLTVGGDSVLSLPLFQVATSSTTPLVTEQFVNVSGSNLNVNYPHYLSLKPGETSLLRFRFGQRSGTGVGSTGGMFLDYEHNWNQGYDRQGGFVVSGLARDDWSVGLRQAWNGKTNIAAQLDLPAHRSLFGNVSLNHPIGGYRLSLSGQHGRSLRGERFESNQANLSIERAPMRLGGLPAQLSYGLTSGLRSIRGNPASQFVGFDVRMDSDPIDLSQLSSLRGTATFGVRRGRNIESNTTRAASLNWDVELGNGLVASTGYEYAVDGFTEEILGSHRLSSQIYWRGGPLSLSSYLTQSLDRDRFSLSGNMDYRLSSLWRLGYGLYTDRFDGDIFSEQTFILGYRLGFREIGLSYSTRTRRLGIELLGTRFN